MTEEEITTLWMLARLLLGLASEGLDRAPLDCRVRHQVPAAGTTRPPAAGRSAATKGSAPGRRRSTPATPVRGDRRGVGIGRTVRRSGAANRAARGTTR